MQDPKIPPPWIEKLRSYGYTLLTGSLSVGTVVSIVDFILNPQPDPPPKYPTWLITVLIGISGLVMVGFAKLSDKIWEYRT